MAVPIHFTALLTFLSEADGGRKTPISDGHRVSFEFPFYNGRLIAILQFTEVEMVFPGDSVKAEISLPDFDSVDGKLYGGLDFEVFETDLLVGSGVITEML